MPSRGHWKAAAAKASCSASSAASNPPSRRISVARHPALLAAIDGVEGAAASAMVRKPGAGC